GNKALVTAIYLAKYGGMKVGVFERRNELGGGWSSEESAAPGFIANTHATLVTGAYMTPVEWDFPELEQYLKFIPFSVSQGGVFNDETGVVFHQEVHDPTQEKTAKSIERLSERDAETWLRLHKEHVEVLGPVRQQIYFNPPAPEGEKSIIEKLIAEKKTGWDPAWTFKSELEMLRDLFESDKLIGALLRGSFSTTGCDPATPGTSSLYFSLISLFISNGCWEGGTHSAAHACHKILLAHGGETFTMKEVDRILIENGRATGIRLTDGTEIAARKLVISTLDPYNLCFRLLGKDHVSGRILRRVAGLSRWQVCITWYSWALKERPRYKAASFEPDVDRVGWLSMGAEDPEKLSRNSAWRRLGKVDPDLNLIIWQHTLVDPTQAPEGRTVCGTEDFVPPANAMTEEEWLAFKKSHAEQVIRVWQEFAPNMTWDNVIGFTPETPYDCCRLHNMAPTGNWAVIDHVPGQMGRNRPIPELAQYKIPDIEGVYCTGSAWHPKGTARSCAAYNCYKIIADDFGLEKPWEVDGRPF
ncbi:NAD(P)/FAD-dependent oxidoreductase, partial [bacterium]